MFIPKPWHILLSLFLFCCKKFELCLRSGSCCHGRLYCSWKESWKIGKNRLSFVCFVLRGLCNANRFELTTLVHSSRYSFSIMTNHASLMDLKIYQPLVMAVSENGLRVAQYFCYLSFGHYIICPSSIYAFGIFILFLYGVIDWF